MHWGSSPRQILAMCVNWVGMTLSKQNIFLTAFLEPMDNQLSCLFQLLIQIEWIHKLSVETDSIPFITEFSAKSSVSTK